jgi:hypothetical protein
MTRDGSPPPSPPTDHSSTADAIRAAHDAPPASPAPLLQRETPFSPPQSSFFHTTSDSSQPRQKRSSDEDRCNTVAGHPSPIKKGVRTPGGSRRGVVFNGSADDDDEMPLISSLQVAEPTPSPGEDFSPAVAVAAVATAAVADGATTTTAPVSATTTATATPPASAKSKSSKKLSLGSDFLTGLRPHVFDKDKFKMGRPELYSREEMAAYDVEYHKQLLFNFDERRGGRAGAVADAIRPTRSAQFDMELDSGEFTGESTDRLRLSRYAVEDLLSCGEGDRFHICIAKDVDSDDDFDRIPSDAALQQMEKNIGGTEWKLGKNEYYVLKGKISNATMHEEIKLGMRERRFFDVYRNMDGCFAVQFEGTEFSMPFSWRYLIENPKKVMFFGPAFHGVRAFKNLFRYKTNMQYVHHIFRNMADECFGDARASALLYATYHKHISDIAFKLVAKANAERDGVLAKATFDTPQAKLFCKIFNKLCRNSFIFSLIYFQDYSQPIVSSQDFLNFLKLSKGI